MKEGKGEKGHSRALKWSLQKEEVREPVLIIGEGLNWGRVRNPTVPSLCIGCRPVAPQLLLSLGEALEDSGGCGRGHLAGKRQGGT